MKIFLRKAFLFSGIIGLVYLLIYKLIPRKYYDDENYALSDVIYQKSQAGGLKGNVLLGDSKPQMGLDARCIHATNLSVSATGPVEGYYQVRQLLQNKTNHIDTIFISYSLRHLLTQDFFYKGSYYDNFINSSFLDSARQIASQNKDPNFDFNKSDFSTLLDQKANSPHLSTQTRVAMDFILGGLNNVFEHYKRYASGTLINDRNQLVNGRLVVFPSDTIRYTRTKNNNVSDEELLTTPPSKVNDIYLDKMVKISGNDHVTLIFILMPGEKSIISPVLGKQVIKLQSIFGRNLINDTSFYNDGYFRDNNGHLNLFGVKRFQKFLEQKLYQNDKSPAETPEQSPGR